MRFMALAVVALGLTMAGPASAGSAAGTVFDDWKVECETPPDTKEERCVLSQMQMVKENNARCG